MTAGSPGRDRLRNTYTELDLLRDEKLNSSVAVVIDIVNISILSIDSSIFF